MPDEQTLIVTRADFESFSRKLDEFVQRLTPGEQGVLTGVMESAAGVPPWWGVVGRHIRIHPMGGKHLVFGGSDGLTVLLGRSGFRVIPPEGPLPTDLPQFLGASLVIGKERGAGV